jgi:hypothetical protein
MEVHKLFWLLGEQANINYDKMPSRGIFQGNISRLYLNETTKYVHVMVDDTSAEDRTSCTCSQQVRQITAGYRRR